MISSQIVTEENTIERLQEEADAAEREAFMTCRLQFVEVKKSEEQLSMDDGPSFVSPNGSFERTYAEKNDISLIRGERSGGLDDLQVEEPILRQSTASKQLKLNEENKDISDAKELLRTK